MTDSPALRAVRDRYAALRASNLPIDRAIAAMAAPAPILDGLGNAEIIAAIERHCAAALYCADLLRAIEAAKHLPSTETKQ